MNRQTLRHFGLDRGPGFYRGDQHDRRLRDILDAVEAREMTAVVGMFGSGKTELVELAQRETPDAEFVWINSPDKERLRVGHVMSAMIEQVSGESPRRSAQALASQLARVLGERVQPPYFRRRVVAVIDNAHRLTAQTLMAIKDLRELRYNGHRPLFSVVLIGQEPLMNLLARHGEVFYRCGRIDLSAEAGWMDEAERGRYLQARFGVALDPTARTRVAALARTPLTMDRLVGQMMEDAYAAGFDTVDERVIQLDPKTRAEAIGASLAEIARAAGVGKTTVADLLAGRAVTADTRAKVEEGLRLLETEAA